MGLTETNGYRTLPAEKLKYSEMTMQDIDAIELNGFFQPGFIVINKGKWDLEKINQNGGSIAWDILLGAPEQELLPLF